MLLNIFLGLVVVGITVVIQGYGTYFWLNRYEKFKAGHSLSYFEKAQVRILILTSVFLIFLHLLQASIWSVIYLAVPGIVEFDTFEKAMYFSLVTFTTLGYGDITIISDNRMLAGLEAINGIILIGWSTAFMFSIYQDIIKRTWTKKGTENK